MGSRGAVHGVIAAPGHDPPDLARRVRRSLGGLLARKARTHKIGIVFPWAEPVGHAAVGAAEGFGWHASGHAVDRHSGPCGWLRCWLLIAATCDAMVVFGEPTPALEWVLGLCPRLGCAVRRAEGKGRTRPDAVRPGRLPASPAFPASPTISER